jgi:hypothetical protein
VIGEGAAQVVPSDRQGRQQVPCRDTAASDTLCTVPRFLCALGVAAQALLVACGNGDAGSSATSPTGALESIHEQIEVVVDPPSEPGEESYLCVAVDAARFAGQKLQSVTWLPGNGPVSIHHATLFAVGQDGPLGAVDCGPFPSGASIIHVYTPGAGALDLPEGVALQVPTTTKRLQVQLHLLRTALGEPGRTLIDLGLLKGSVEHVAAWVDDYAPVPPLVPHVPATQTGLCRFPVSGRLVYSWPHMHEAGASFTGVMIRADGTSETVVQVPAWDFRHQAMYPLDIEFEAGDAMQTSCTWLNTTDQIVVPGPYSFQEMCNQGLYVWPPEAARCEP